ncbi:hypothetical protein GCM10027275_28890 [Rhabdobacter roseus]|uniref:Outer membrane protein beta-barrel domain-containing protein n=1 Tax=Rhabdobacter roseus TaxID=1655419 RepID=A0A840TYY9_9BACT|nr:hypothetical protein [Rhabdobacter roseus]MBB5284839.1 hypothetical protein [Rhabdobacter roseus]
MKNILKKVVLGTLGLLIGAATQAEPAAKDSIIVTFGDKTRLIIYGEDRQELEKLMKYDLNALLKDLGARLDTLGGDTKIYLDELDGRDYLKDKSEANRDKNHVRIGLRGIHIKDGDTEVSISTRGIDVKEGEERVRIGRGDEDSSDSSGIKIDEDGHVTRIRRVRRYSSPRKGFNLNLGLNAYGENQPMGYNTADYDLRPFGSRFVSLGLIRSASIARGKSAGLHLDFGLDFSWYNLMFDGNNTVVKGASQLAFEPILNAEGTVVDLRKSKLTVPYVNLSLMPTVSFPKAAISYISAGVYGGYRLGGYTKTKLASNGKKDHNRANYYFEDFRYGAALELGIRNFPDLFVQYDMNNLFEENRGPAVRMISFGIRL